MEQSDRLLPYDALIAEALGAWCLGFFIAVVGNYVLGWLCHRFLSRLPDKAQPQPTPRAHYSYSQLCAVFFEWELLKSILRVSMVGGFYLCVYSLYFRVSFFDLRWSDVSLVKVVAGLLLSDGINFLLHYGMHCSKRMYRFVHAMHHSIKYAQVISVHGLFVSLAEAIIFEGCFVLGFALVKLTPSSVMFASVIYLFHLNIAHDNIEVKYLNFFFNDGITHLMHHRYVRCNYGVMFSVFDRIFGTFKSPYDRK